MRALLGMSLFVGLALVLPVTVFADELENLANQAGGCDNTTFLTFCFTRLTTLGTVQLFQVNPNVTPGSGNIAYLGVVRLTIEPNVLELPAFSADASDLCAPYSVLPFPCTVVLSIPVSEAPNANPQLEPLLFVGTAYAGTLTIKVNNNPAAVIPGYVTLEGCTPASGTSTGFDIDCDGVTNSAELDADSNPFYAYSIPADKGRGFLGGYELPSTDTADIFLLLNADWDGDNQNNLFELDHLTDPFHRCKDPNHPTVIGCGAP